MLGVDVDVLPADRREPAETDGEHPLENDREEEDRDGDADQRQEEARVVEDSAVAFRGKEAEWHAEDEGEEPSGERQLDRGREALLELLGDRSPRDDARPEVTFGKRLHVSPVLDVERVVETQLVADLCNRLLVGAFAQERFGWCPGQRPDPDEDE